MQESGTKEKGKDRPIKEPGQMVLNVHCSFREAILKRRVQHENTQNGDATEDIKFNNPSAVHRWRGDHWVRHGAKEPANAEAA